MIRRRRHAYVLLLTLMLLALAAVAMQSIVLASMRSALRSAGAQDELQRRWGMISCQRTLLESAPTVLKHASAAAQHPVASVRTTLVLGRQRFDLLFSDEQAKANANALYDRLGSADFQKSMRSALGGAVSRIAVKPKPLRAPQPEPEAPTTEPSSWAPSANVRPTIGRPPNAPRAGNMMSHPLSPPTTGPSTQAAALSEPASPPAFDSFEQVFERIGPYDLIDAGERSVANGLTCWGPAKLNFRTASEAALIQVCCPPLNDGQVRQMLATRRQSPQLSLAKVLDALTLNIRTRSTVDARLAEKSTCFSLWIACRADDKSWYRLAISDPARDKGQVVCYEW